MNLDIHDAFVMLVILTLLAAVASVWGGIRAIRKGRKVAYFRLRRRQVAAGWRTILFAIFLIGLAFLLGRFGEPAAYHYFPPSPSPLPSATLSLTPTISQIPTITDTPTITLTPAESYTPTETATPFVPLAIEIQFKSSVTPLADAVFSPLIFSKSVENYEPISVQTVFQNPVKTVYVSYSYDKMTDGVQWTALWYRDGELVYYETDTWAGGTGGVGVTKWNPPPQEWLPGTYQVIFFIGAEWKVSGQFLVTGNPPTAIPSPTPSNTPTASQTRPPTQTFTITRTPSPSWTPMPTDTRWPTETASKTPTKVK